MTDSGSGRPPQPAITAPVVAPGLAGGYATARFSGVRLAGGVVLAAAGARAAWSWRAAHGPAVAVAPGAVYLGAFAASHPLAARIGAWPSVALVTAVASGVAGAADLRAARSLDATGHRRRRRPHRVAPDGGGKG